MEVLVEQYRGEVLENTHHGYICIVNEKEEVVYSVGDPNTTTLFRSASKPIQVLPVIMYGGIEKYDLKDNELAIMAASHKAEEFHIAALESIMMKTGLREESLYCPPTYPGYVKKSPDIIKKVIERGNLEKRRLNYNCSGKHLGLMISNMLLGYPVENYWDLNHPIQSEINRIISIISSYPSDKIKAAIDGCGIPVYAIPIKNIANSFMKLANPDNIGDEIIEEAVKKIQIAMNTYPENINGTNSLCALLNSDPNIIAKSGAQGVYALGLKKEKLGIVVKLMDGSFKYKPFIIANILKKIEYSNKELIEEIHNITGSDIKNERGDICGKIKVTFK